MFSKGQNILKEALMAGPSSLSGVHQNLAFQDVLHGFLKTFSEDKKTLLIFADEDSLDEFLIHCPFACLSLKSFGASPYSGLEPSSQISPSRIHFLHAALSESHKVFATYTEALLFKTLSPAELSAQTKTFEFADAFFTDPTADLIQIGYTPSQFVEKPGQFCDKGGILDVFSPAHAHPHRIELFGNDIESLRKFSTETQRTLEEVPNLTLVPAHECIYNKENKPELLNFASKVSQNDSWKKDLLHKIRNEIPFSEKEFFIPLFYKNSQSALNYFDPKKTNIVEFDSNQIRADWTLRQNNLNDEFESFDSDSIKYLKPSQLYAEHYDLSAFQRRTDVCSVSVSYTHLTLPTTPYV